MKKLLENKLILDEIKEYELKILTCNSDKVELMDSQTADIITLNKEELINYFLIDHKHRYEETDSEIELDIINKLQGLLV